MNFVKIVSMVIALVMLCACATQLPIGAVNIAAAKNSTAVSNNLLNVFSAKMSSIQKENQSLSIARILPVKDFSGEDYSVIEGNPTGYMIYHPESGVFVESSPSAPSPYAGLSGSTLYYGGPTEYYIEEGGIFYHTVIDEIIDNSVDVQRMNLTSANMTAELNQNKSIVTLDYVINSNTTAYATMVQANTTSVQSGLTQAQVDWFKNLSSCGYFSVGDGCCGFVGLNILYAFFDKFVDDKYMDDQYWTNASKTQLKNNDSSFTKYLYDLDPKDTTTSIHIHSVSKQYLSLKGITDIDHTDRYWGFFTKSTIRGILDNGYPVELFGSLADPPNYSGTGKKSGHAVVAYQYSGDDFICHYGWNGYAEVTIVGTLGSIYAMEVK